MDFIGDTLYGYEPLGRSISSTGLIALGLGDRSWALDPRRESDRSDGAADRGARQASSVRPEAKFLELRKTAGSVIDFVVEMFQYRYTSFARYLGDFERASGRRVDLTLTAMVDYDWWLNSGRPTETSLQDQVDLMSDLAVVTGGRLHFWAPFCPYREAQFRLKSGSTFSSLKLVQDAVNTKGATGVKIYPPMGFAPYGNATVNPNIWRSASWLSGLALFAQVHGDPKRYGTKTARSDAYEQEIKRLMQVADHSST